MLFINKDDLLHAKKYSYHNMSLFCIQYFFVLLQVTAIFKYFFLNNLIIEIFERIYIEDVCI